MVKWVRVENRWNMLVSAIKKKIVRMVRGSRQRVNREMLLQMERQLKI